MTSSSRLLALILAAALTATACHRNPEVRAREALARGDAYLAQHKIREATIEYRNAVQAQPTRADAHYKLAKAYAEAGDPIKAYEEYSRAVNDDNARRRTLRGSCPTADGQANLAGKMTSSTSYAGWNACSTGRHGSL